MLASVPITPTLPFLVARTAAWAAGSTTPYTGTAQAAFNSSMALEDIVPQATTRALGPKEPRKAASCRA